jgi:hypothetical protein
MLPNEDRISRPAKGRSFPVSVGDVNHLINEFGFCAPSSRKRLDVVFQNPRSSSELGLCIAGFFPADALVVCSVPSARKPHAKAAFYAAIRAFSERSPDVPPRWNDRVEISYWAYLGPLNRLCITKRTRKARCRAFRGGGRLLSNVSSLGKKATEEYTVSTLDIAEQAAPLDARESARQ